MLGEPFVKWILVAPFELPSPGQLEVAAALTRFVREGSADHSGRSADLVGMRLSFYVPAWNATFVEGLRQRAGGQPAEAEASEDDLQNAVVDLAAQSYGQLLLPAGFTGPSLSANLMSPAGARVVAAVRADGIFPGADDDWGSESIVLGTTLGTAQGQQAAIFGNHVLLAAWDAVRLRVEGPTLEEYLSAVRQMLTQTRALLRGEEVLVPSLVGFTGIVVDQDVEVVGSWGRLRSARPSDLPSFASSMSERRINTTTETGEHIEITDAGDVVLETRIPYRVRIQSPDEMIMEGTTTVGLEALVEQARICLALSWDGDQIPVVLPTWRRTISFMTSSIGYWTDPQHSAPRHPTKATRAQMDAWGSWLGTVDTEALSHVRLAATRTLRALTERRVQDDMLIDAVIAWESLFGAKTESTLRVSGALACLLYPPGADREAAQKRYSKIYNSRSEIVHASLTKKTTPEVIAENAREAAQVAIRALRAILDTRRDLITLDSASRGLQLLLEGSFPQAADAETLTSEAASGDGSAIDANG
nr:hypothetical protein Ade03nite_08980 [Actinoplanes derwentensis]